MASIMVGLIMVLGLSLIVRWRFLLRLTGLGIAVLFILMAL